MTPTRIMSKSKELRQEKKEKKEKKGLKIPLPRLCLAPLPNNVRSSFRAYLQPNPNSVGDCKCTEEAVEKEGLPERHLF